MRVQITWWFTIIRIVMREKYKRRGFEEYKMYLTTLPVLSRKREDIS